MNFGAFCTLIYTVRQLVAQGLVTISLSHCPNLLVLSERCETDTRLASHRQRSTQRRDTASYAPPAPHRHVIWGVPEVQYKAGMAVASPSEP